MPHLRFRSVSQEIVKKASMQLPKELSEIMSTDVDNFSFEKIDTNFFQNGRAIESYPFVEVFWFARDQDTKNKSANCITHLLKNELGAVDIVVVFVELNKDSYFENGKHF